MTSIEQQNIIRNTIEQKVRVDRFKGTFLSQVYNLANNEKGCIGELLLSDYVKENSNFSVEGRKNSEQDLIINGVKTEVKIAFCPENNIIWNPIVLTNDWDIIVFIFCKPNSNFECGVEIEYWYCTKDEAIYFVENNPDQSIWRLRDKGSENTYIVGAPLKTIKNHPLFKDFLTWDGTVMNKTLIKVSTLEDFM